MAKLTMKPLASSVIHSYAHDPATNELHVTFRGKNGPGSTHIYSGFGSEDLSAFEKSESKGKHFGSMIKGSSKHPSRKLG